MMSQLISERKKVAVLCASRNSIYKTFDLVEVYDETRDARMFDCSMPIVAHPPCRAWSAYCRHQAKPKPGEHDLAPYCVDALAKCGGILEHPAHSTLWITLGLPDPGIGIVNGMWTMEVNQSWWGDTRIKKTWLLIAGVMPCDLPDIPFRLHNPSGDRRRWQLMSRNQRAATVPAFAEWLINVAKRVSAVRDSA